MKLFTKTLTAVCLLMLSWTFPGMAQNEMIDEDGVVADVREKYLADSKSVLIYNGNREIPEGRTIKSDILLLNGDLIIAGTVEGKIVVSNGNIIMRETGSVTRDAVSINGRVETVNSDQIAGNILQVKSSQRSTNKQDIAAKQESNFSADEFTADETSSEATAYTPSVKSNSYQENDPEELNDDEILSTPPTVQRKDGARVYDYKNKRKNKSITPYVEVPPVVEAPNADNMTEADWKRFNREMEKFNRKMEKFNRKMARMNETVEKDLPEYEYNYTPQTDEDDNEDEDRSHSASFVRVDNVPRRNEDRTSPRYYSRNNYWDNHQEKLRNTSFVLFDYNRVDGLYIGGKIDRDHKIYDNKPFQIYGEAGYAFGPKDFHYRLGLDKIWGSEYRFTLGGEVHDLTTTNDNWIVGQMENAMNSMLLKIDNRDYFRTRGFSFQAQQNLSRQFKISVAYKVDDYSSASNNVNWALFRSKKIDFRTNPMIDEGRMNSVVVRAELNTRGWVYNNRKYSKRVGWDIYGEAERSRDEWNSDFDFSRYVLSIARYQPLSRYENLDMRLMLGSVTGTVPAQKMFHLGGISTLRGHDYKAMSGNQMALANVEYRISSGALKNDRIFPIHPFSAILFADAGYAWNNTIYSIRELARGTNLRDIQTDLGVGIGDENDLFRFDIAKSVSEKGSPYKFAFRVNYIF